jgi:O-antigen/teichoic acid export membrane protein
MLLGMSIGPILLRVGADATMDPKIIHLLIRQLSLIIFPAGLAVVAAIALVGEPLLRWMLGEQWRVEAAFVVPITVAVTVRACVSPLSAILISLRRFDLALGWQITYFLSSLGVLSISARYLNFSDFVLVYAAHEFLLYSIYLSLIARAVRKSSCAPYSV